MNKYIPVIGLEVHVELKTNSKMFCGCSATHFGVEPNTHTCPVCLGLPGALPVSNKKAIEWCVKIGMALNCETPLFSKFDRKNYFYPDLSKGYQISQYDEPFAINGHVILGSSATTGSDSGRARMTKKIRIRRVHMEEDTGKLQHATVNGEKVSLVDFNRSGVPLVEIVTEPDFESAEQVSEYLKKLQQIVRYLGVSDADMDKGQMRLEPNISLARCTLQVAGSKVTDYKPQVTRHLPPYKVEVKNINSFRFVDKAIAYEIKRQTEILESGKTPEQVTMGWNEIKNKTVPQRSKEEAHDYRYFPEPDIPPIRWTKDYLEALRSSVTAIIKEKEEQSPEKKDIPMYINMGISAGSAATIAYSTLRTNIFGTAMNQGTVAQDQFVNFGNFIANIPIQAVDNNQVTELTQQLSDEFNKKQQIVSIDEGALGKIIDEVVAENEKAVADYKKGKENVIMFLVGMVMRKASEKLDAKMVNEKIIEKIK